MSHSSVGARNPLAPEASSSSSPSSNRGNTVQADPLPRKVGELGYDAAVHGVSTPRSGTSPDSTPLGPHPAERNEPNTNAPATASSPREMTHSRTDTSSTASSEESPAAQTTSPAGQSSTSLAPSATSVSSISRIRKKFIPSPKPSKHLWGMAPRTLCKFFLLFFFLAGVCAGWGIAINANAKGSGSLFGGGGGMNVVVFVHVAFSVIVLTQLLFIERTIFRLRAERFSFLHPEAELPTTRHPFGRSRAIGLAFAPWQRPPLPTYAAALRAAPTATGDVEDQEIARMVAIGRGDVPPTYGNTRGSTLLAYGLGAGPLANHRISGSSQRTTASRAPSNGGGSRPVSYGESQQIEDALRAVKLEESLSRLEAAHHN